MHSTVRTKEKHENARLEDAQENQKMSQARHIVTGLKVLGVGKWEFREAVVIVTVPRTMASL
jgi:hypothetical protein